MKYLFLILTIITILIIAFLGYQSKKERFNQDTGQFCGSCANKTFNECLNCFNCGYCVDKWGNGKCIGGDVTSGPYNKENCALWYTTDNWTGQVWRNNNYKLNYGPKQANRLIGINPC
ncbi:hypothetical protein Indivirus_1_218 [Indivirus ILV1]|uniref:Uncharacterized protein n=1 Tax=Indivirus ILV1 TaxID=1977633 RepID=A0A1V0SD06_9VIRU|nr:hypothetical protein Indivirus_1_218 [Indivirus ILV1]